MSDDWVALTDNLKACAIAEPGKLDPRNPKPAKSHEAEILGWKFKVHATEMRGPSGTGRLWVMAATRAGEPDEECSFNTRMLIKRFGVPDHCAKPISRDRDHEGRVTWTWGWSETVMKTPKKARPNDPCPCGKGYKFKRCCGRKA